MILSHDTTIAKYLRLAIDERLHHFDYDGIRMVDLWEFHLFLEGTSNSPELNFEDVLKEVIKQAKESDYDTFTFTYNGMDYEIELETDPYSIIF